MWDTTHTTNKGEKCTGSDKYMYVKWRYAQSRPERSTHSDTEFGKANNAF